MPGTYSFGQIARTRRVAVASKKRRARRFLQTPVETGRDVLRRVQQHAGARTLDPPLTRTSLRQGMDSCTPGAHVSRRSRVDFGGMGLVLPYDPSASLYLLASTQQRSESGILASCSSIRQAHPSAHSASLLQIAYAATAVRSRVRRLGHLRPSGVALPLRLSESLVPHAPRNAHCLIRKN